MNVRSIDRNRQFRFGRAIVKDIEASGIIESTLSGLDTSIHISKRAGDEEQLMEALREGGPITIPFSSHRIERAI